jgi:hypothetical protein
MKNRTNRLQFHFVFACCLLGALTVLFAQTPSSRRPDLVRLRTSIQVLRSGDDAELSISFDQSTFTVRKGVRVQIDAVEGRKLLDSSTLDEPPGVRVAQNKFFVVTHVSASTWIETELVSQGGAGGEWNKKTLEPIATFPSGQWSAFINFTSRLGLMHYASYSSDQGNGGILLFSSKGPSSVSSTPGTLQLSDEFYRYMRLSPTHPPSAGSTGFVIIVHDPHSDVAGRFTLLRGLEALISANPQMPVSFMNEGHFPETPGIDYSLLRNRRISDGGLSAALAQITDDASRKAAIFRLTEKLLVDVPRAYQEMNPGKAISSYKIDDNRYLSESRYTRISDESEQKAIRTVFERARKVVIAAKSSSSDQLSSSAVRLLQELLFVSAMERADVTEMSDEDSIAFSTLLAGELKGVANKATRLFASDPSVISAAATLRTRADEYSQEVESDTKALQRNVTMSHFLVVAGQHPRSYGGTPIAFIGSYHTQGITAELRKNGIGYVVMEPIRATPFPAPDSEEKTFDQFVVDRDAYFRSLKQDKGAAELTPAQVRNYVIPLSSEAKRQYDAKVLQIVSQIGSDSTISARLLSTAILDNPYSFEASVSIAGGNGGVPPDLPKGAFAYFDSSGGKRRLVLLGPREDGWKENSRYEFLNLVALRLPERQRSSSTLHCVDAMSIFWQDALHTRGFFSFYDGRTDRLYLTDSHVADVSALLTPPMKKGSESTEFGMQLSEVETDSNVQGALNDDIGESRHSEN